VSESDFGRGYATCLRQFVNHRARLGETLHLYEDMRQRHGTLFSEESAVEIWANGASDHLYELRRPRRAVPVSEWRRARALQDRALDIGHGFRPSSKAHPTEARALLDEAEALLGDLSSRGFLTSPLTHAFVTDEKLGLRPVKGTWACEQDLTRVQP